MSLDKALKNMKHDVRLAEYNLAQGQLTEKEKQEYLKNLPDSAANSEPLAFDESADDDALDEEAH